MGYRTEFVGDLDFNRELTVDEIEFFEKYLGNDLREFEETKDAGLTWVDLEFTDDCKGLTWDGSEKTYDLPEKINLLMKLANEKFDIPLTLSGEMTADGDEMGDLWFLRMVDGVATEVNAEITELGKTCPHCGEKLT